MAKVIQWKHGSSEDSAVFTGALKEITIDDDLHTIRLHDGETPGGALLARVAEVPTKLSQLVDDLSVWRSDELTKLSQLTNDKGFWATGALTKVSQLQNDSGFLTGHCTYCTHCTYCQQCSNCHNCTTINCTTINCTTVNCTTIQCSVYSYCTKCNCDCTDDSCFVSGKLETSKGLIDVHNILIGDEIIDWLGKPVKVVGVSHGHLGSRRAIQMKGRGVNRVTDDHPMLIFRTKRRSYELCACINSKFDPNKIILADNGVRGRYSEEHDYCGWFIPTIGMPADTPTVCPIAEREAIVKFGNGYVLVPGRLS